MINFILLFLAYHQYIDLRNKFVMERKCMLEYIYLFMELLCFQNLVIDEEDSKVMLAGGRVGKSQLAFAFSGDSRLRDEYFDKDVGTEINR